MTASDGKTVLPIERFNQLLEVKKQIQEEALGQLPEQLGKGTLATVMRLARQQRVSSQVLCQRVLALVRKELRDLARRGWKPDTVFILRNRPWERGSHGSAD